MKAILSNKIYMVVSPTLHRKLEKELTYTVPSYNSPDKFITIKNLKVINFNIDGGNLLVSFPIGRIDLIPDNYEIVDKRILNPVEFPNFKFSLRDSQQDIHDDISDNCIINAKVGYGKTFLAIKIAQKLGQKTLIVVHTVALRSQWEKEIIKTLDIKPGVIGSGKYNIDSPIVVANVQSLSKHTNVLSKEFGTIILDEMHHVSSPTFSKAIDSSFARYKIGLSGTIERKDQKHVVFKDYFGTKIYKPDKENTMTPEVHVVNSGIIFPDAPGISWAEKVNILTSSPLYKRLIVALADNYAKQGHKVAIVSDRLEFLKECNETSSSNSSLLVGGIKEVDRDNLIKNVHNGTIDQVWATQSLLSEGISIEPLSCLILAAPLNNNPLLEQLIGRIIRKHPDKLNPIVVDIRLLGGIVTNQYNNRLGFYMKEGYNISFIK